MLGVGRVLSEYFTDVSTQMKTVFQDARLDKGFSQSSVRPDTLKWPEMQWLLRPKRKQPLKPEVKKNKKTTLQEPKGVLQSKKQKQ